MKRLLRIAVVTIVLFFGVIQATPTIAISIGFDPSSQIVDIGDLFDIDVVVSGLDAAGEIVSAYDLDVLYDDAVLSATAVTFGLDLGDPFFFEVFNGFDISTPGLVDFAQLSFLSDLELNAIQGDTVTLATLYFQVVGLGTSLLTFDPDPAFGIDVKGNNASLLAFSEVGTARVAPVPEPTTLLLTVSGLAGLFGMRRKPRKR